MFGLEHVNAAKQWLESDPAHWIEIHFSDGDFRVDLYPGTPLDAVHGVAPDLMDALKSALAGLPK